MPQTSKVAISLTANLMEEMERARRETGETRSAFVRRAVEIALRINKNENLGAKYQEGYRRQPETEEEVFAAEASAADLLSQEPWE